MLSDLASLNVDGETIPFLAEPDVHEREMNSVGLAQRASTGDKMHDFWASCKTRGTRRERNEGPHKVTFCTSRFRESQKERFSESETRPEEEMKAHSKKKEGLIGSLFPVFPRRRESRSIIAKSALHFLGNLSFPVYTSLLPHQ
jgi:hypothetical protein